MSEELREVIGQILGEDPSKEWSEDVTHIVDFIERYAADREREARIGEASWWTRNYTDPAYEPLLSERLNRLKKHRKVQGDSHE